MPTVDLITFCCPKDIHQTYAGWDALVGSHKYPFREIILIRQRCRGIDARPSLHPSVRVVESEDYPDIYSDYGIDVNDPEVLAAESPNNRYFWKYHSMNHFIGLKVSSAEYITFTDCDNLLEGDVEGNSWVDRGIRILQDRPEILMICPNQWREQRGDVRVEAVSQCMFLCERQRLLGLDYNVPCPAGVELNNFHLQFEGRLWRYSQKHGACRVMLGWPPLMKHLAW